MTDDKDAEREQAIAAADGTCPRCGATREPKQEYCLECGFTLPKVTGRLANWRRRWIRRFGWYPGDWVWVSLLTLLIAIAGATASIALSETTVNDTSGTFVQSTPTTVPVTTPAPVPTTTATTGTSTLPTPPESTTTTSGPKTGRLAWPANENGWTIVLVSYPKTNGTVAAQQTAAKAAHSGLHQVGVLDSSAFASLQPGYLVVFTGIYGSKSDADAAVATARQAGFGGAYTRQVAR
jgi:ribosomal protein L37E